MAEYTCLLWGLVLLMFDLPHNLFARNNEPEMNTSIVTIPGVRLNSSAICFIQSF